MNNQLAPILREALKSEYSKELGGWAKDVHEKLENLLHKQVADDLSVGLLLGGAKTAYGICNVETDDVIVFLLTDPTDIDSKQITCVRKSRYKDFSAVMKQTYRFNPSKADAQAAKMKLTSIKEESET